jgi:hypothetical protein
MAINDYIPNIFGQQGSMYEGLLSPQESAGLSQRSNIAGLLGTAAALAQGMSKQGPRRSGLQNVLGALGAGYGASGQAYQGGIEQMANAQKLAQLKLQMQQNTATQQAIQGLINDPRIANDPLKVAYIRSNPNEALKLYSELLPIQEAARGGQPQVPQVPQAQQAQQAQTVVPQVDQTLPQEVIAAGEMSLPSSVTSATASKATPLIQQKDYNLGLIQTYSQPQFLGNEKAAKILENATKSIETIDKQLNKISVQEFDWAGIEKTIPPQFKNSVSNLKQIAQTGDITADVLTQRLRDIEKEATAYVLKKQDYTNQDRRVAAGMFEGRAIETLTPIELMQLENKLYDMRITEKKAGATTINMPSESERTAGYLTTRLKNSLEQYQIAIGQTPKAAMPNMMGEVIKGITRSDYLKNLATPEARQRVEAAQLDMLDAALTMATGAAYTREQLESTRRTLFPELGDKPATIRDKAKRLDDLLKEAAMTKAGRAAPKDVSAPAFTPNDISNAAQQELDRRKGNK